MTLPLASAIGMKAVYHNGSWILLWQDWINTTGQQHSYISAFKSLLFIYNCFTGKNILSVKVKLLSTLWSECHIIKNVCSPSQQHTMYHHYNNQNLNMPTSGSAFVRRNVDGTSTSAVSMQVATPALTISVSFSNLIVWMVCCKIRKDNSESKAQSAAT